MKTVDEQAMEIIREWRGRSYHNEGQADAALQSAIVAALNDASRNNVNDANVAKGGDTDVVVARSVCINIKQ